MFYIVEKIWWVLGMAIGRVVHRYIVRESIPARQNSTHTRTHKRSWVWICIHSRTRRVSAIQWISVTRPPTTRLFGLRNELVHHLLTPHFFVWFVE
jgi:hypothetical protein